MSAPIRPGRPEDLPAILGIMRQSLGWPSDERAELLWRWKHEANPFGASPVWVGVDGDTVVAVRAFMRWEIVMASGEVVRAVRAVDTATDPAHQGRGWFRRLTLHGLDELAADGVELVFNTPNDASRPGYLSMGWIEQDRLDSWIRVLKPTAARRLLRSRVPADLWPLSGASAPGVVEPSVAFGPGAEVTAALDAANRRPGGAVTRRSVEFYRWRYGLAALGYGVVTGPGGVAQGFAVVRARRRGDTRELAVLDVVSAEPGSASLLARACRVGACDHAVTVGRRPAATWLPMRGLGPRLVARPLSGRPLPEAWDLGLGDVELL